MGKDTYFKKKYLSFFILLFLFAINSLIFPQTGTLKGKIFDKSTNDALIGANIVVNGTSLGGVADFDGNFTVHNVPVGKQSVKISYIGYRTITEDITIKSGNNEQNFYLESEAMVSTTIEVTAQAEGQLQAINQQLTSNTIINVVSAEKIHQLPDDNAATALSRLPGVSLMNGDQVVIRGVQAKLNQILLNGIELPSTDMNTRATNLGFISSNLLSGIEVIKAITPDMDANALGGVVNLRLREAPKSFHFDVLAQGDYNSQDHVYGNYKFWASASNRFFDDKFGVFVQGNMNRSDGGDQRAAVTLATIGTNTDVFGQGNSRYQINGAQFQYAANTVKNSGGSLILDYILPDGKIVFQNTYAGNLTDQLNNYITLSFDNTNITYTPDRSLFGKDLWINALQVEHNIGDIKIQASLSHSSTQQYTRYGYSPGINGAGWSQFGNSADAAPFGYDAQGKPITYLADAQQQLDFNSTLSIFNNINPADAAGATIQGWTQSIARQFKQHLYNGALDISKPVSFSDDVNAIFKVGGKFVRTTRQNNIDEKFAHGVQDLYLNPDANAYLGGVNVNNPVMFSMVMNNDFKRGKYYLNDLYDFTNGGFKYTLDRNVYDKWLQLSELGWQVPVHYADTYKDDWNGAEQFSAGYLMGTFNIGPRLTLLGGVRFESYNMQYHAQFTFIQHNVYGNAISTDNGSVGVSESKDYSDPNLKYTVPYNAFNVNRTDNNIFPNAQLKYSFNEWSDLRLAYTTGISRPDYTAIIPKVAFQRGNFELGNPLLKPSTAKNIDVITTFHNNYVGLLTINGFYKEISNAMYFTSIYYTHRAEYASGVYVPDSLFLSKRFGFDVPNTQTVQINLNNPNKGYIRGIEVDWQTNFWYLPGVLSSLVLDINYTKSGSNTAYTVLTPSVFKIKYTDSNGRIKTRDSISTVTSNYNGRMIQQANDVVNIALGADYLGFHARISFSMTGNVINGIGTRPEEASYTGNIYRWDFTVKQELPVEGLSVSLNGMNIFHNGIKSYRNYKRTNDAPVTKNLVSVFYSPSLFEMNLRYSF